MAFHLYLSYMRNDSDFDADINTDHAKLLNLHSGVRNASLLHKKSCKAKSSSLYSNRYSKVAKMKEEAIVSLIGDRMKTLPDELQNVREALLRSLISQSLFKLQMIIITHYC